MEFKDLYLNDELEIGKPCYWDHSEYIYKGLNEEGKHIIEKSNANGVEIKYIESTPTLPQLPMNTYIYRVVNGKTEYAEIVKSFNMLQKHYYKVMKYSNSFSEYDSETYEELTRKWKVAKENPYMELDEIYEALEPFDDEINEIESKIRELEKEKREVESKRKEVTAKCKHKWYKGEEEEIRKNYYERECECEYCGERQTNTYYTF